MGWTVLIELSLAHDYYAPAMPPLTVRPADAKGFAHDGLLLRQSGGQVFVLAEERARDLPAAVTLDLEAQNTDVISVTEGGDWRCVPQLVLPVGTDAVTLSAMGSDLPQRPGHVRLARVSVAVDPQGPRKVAAHFAAVASHWAYHVIGPGSDDVLIEDSAGQVHFDAMGMIALPDGTPAQVIRSREALPARARPGQRFSLSRPGPFGPRMLIPVLPAPRPHFAQVPGPKGAGEITQSDIYVSIF